MARQAILALGVQNRTSESHAWPRQIFEALNQTYPKNIIWLSRVLPKLRHSKNYDSFYIPVDSFGRFVLVEFRTVDLLLDSCGLLGVQAANESGN